MTAEDKGFNSGGAVPEDPELLHSNKEEEQEQQQELVPYLDEDIITKILIKVDSAESLFNSLRYVCKLWYNIISHHPDIHLNNLLPSSKPPCLIIQHMDHSSHRYIKTKTEEEASAIYTDPRYTTCAVKLTLADEGVLDEQQVVDDLTPPFNKLLIKACANGKMLASPYGAGNFQTLYVVDPRTNHCLALPPCPVDVISPSVEFIFLPCTRKYKVVIIADQLRKDGSPYLFFQILTLSCPSDFCGSSSSSSSSSSNDDDDDDDDLGRMWKLIELPELIRSMPLAINGFFYWSTFSCRTQCITSFDVAAEVFCTTRHPLYRCVGYTDTDIDISGFMDISGYLAYWWLQPEDEGLMSWTLDVHVIEDLHKTGAEWKELYGGVTMDPGFTASFGWKSYGSKSFGSKPPLPVLSVGNGQVIIFRTIGPVGGPLLAYNVKSHKWWPLGIDLKQPEDGATFVGFNVPNTVPFDTLYCLKPGVAACS